MNQKPYIHKASYFLQSPFDACPRSVLTILIPILLLTQLLTAQSIGNWTFNSILSGTPGTFNTVSNADFSSSVPIHSFNGGTEYFGENGWPSGTINTSMYLQFTLTPLSGYQLDISSIVLTLRRSNTGSPAGSGPTSWAIRSSLDGYATNISTGSMTLNYANYTITPGSAFLNIYTPVTFRIYGYTATVSSGGSSRMVFDNIKVNGIGYLLPVRLGVFTASAGDDRVKLTYSVNNTQINDKYIIERSLNGTNFNMLTTVEEIANAAEKKYTYTDNTGQLNAKQLFYRMRLQNNAGGDVYSAIVTVNVKNQPVIKMYVYGKQLYINGIFQHGGVYRADIYNTSSQLLTSLSFQAIVGYNNFTLAIPDKIPASCIILVANGKGYAVSVMTVQ